MPSASGLPHRRIDLIALIIEYFLRHFRFVVGQIKPAYTLAGVLFGIVGILLIFIGSRELFGAQIAASIVGAACIFVGGVTTVFAVRRIFDALDTEPKERLLAAPDVEAAAWIINLANVIGIFAGIIFGILGVLLVYLGGREAESTVYLLGAKITTGSIGVAGLFIGAGTVIMTILRTFKSLDVAIRR